MNVRNVRSYLQNPYQKASGKGKIAQTAHLKKKWKLSNINTGGGRAENSTSGRDLSNICESVIYPFLVGMCLNLSVTVRMCPNARSTRVLTLSLPPSNFSMLMAMRFSTINFVLTCAVFTSRLNTALPSLLVIVSLKSFFHMLCK